MFITELDLKNYRNYEEAKIKFSKGFNILFGDNAQGKTNILESILLCSTGRSHRTSKDSELIKFGADFFNINITVKKETQNKNINMRYINNKKNIKINDLPLKKMGDLMGNLITVMFSPEDISIVKEGPSLRRKFIDIAISQIKPTYFYDLQKYNKILSQRNYLLKEINYKNKFVQKSDISGNTSDFRISNSSGLDNLEIWNNNLAEVGARIIKNRFDFLEKMNLIIQKNHGILTNEKEVLNIKYSSSIKSNDFTNVLNIKDSFLKALKFSQNRDLKTLTTSVGVHRDDYDFLLNGLSLKTYGSQGQQRTAILSLKITELEIIKKEVGEYPVLVLDDVMSELDNKRKEYLINHLQNIQTFITTTEKTFFEGKNMKQISFFNINDGKIIESIS